MLSKVIQEGQRDWDERLQSVMAAYRASLHDSTGLSPNFVLLGRESRAPLDLVIGPPEEGERVWGSVDDYVYHQQQVKRDAYALVREHMGCVAERSKNQYDLRARPVEIKVGDWVYVYSPRRYVGRNVKWQHFYSGPFLVTKQLGPVNFVVQRTARSLSQVVHVDKMKRCLGSTPVSWLFDPAASDSVSAPENAPWTEVVNEPPVVGAEAANSPLTAMGDPTDQSASQGVRPGKHEVVRPKDVDEDEADPQDQENTSPKVVDDGVGMEPTRKNRPKRNAPMPRRYLDAVYCSTIKFRW